MGEQDYLEPLGLPFFGTAYMFQVEIEPLGFDKVEEFSPGVLVTNIPPMDKKTSLTKAPLFPIWSFVLLCVYIGLAPF
jgi:hypothetical protein